tara:strand:- start:541 stop:723 length:183 start_codon:yes stop_codon:yes gene_type:complete
VLPGDLLTIYRSEGLLEEAALKNLKFPGKKSENCRHIYGKENGHGFHQKNLRLRFKQETK